MANNNYRGVLTEITDRGCRQPWSTRHRTTRSLAQHAQEWARELIWLPAVERIRALPGTP